ncbi:hypothetical protein HOY82DRAFT_589767 [Tuber indicum]|nr:hypothetical protein HOY82DRAFT_589767 [Tuber indicum]
MARCTFLDQTSHHRISCTHGHGRCHHRTTAMKRIVRTSVPTTYKTDRAETPTILYQNSTLSSSPDFPIQLTPASCKWSNRDGNQVRVKYGPVLTLIKSFFRIPLEYWYSTARVCVLVESSVGYHNIIMKFSGTEHFNVSSPVLIRDSYEHGGKTNLQHYHCQAFQHPYLRVLPNPTNGTGAKPAKNDCTIQYRQVIPPRPEKKLAVSHTQRASPRTRSFSSNHSVPERINFSSAQTQGVHPQEWQTLQRNSPPIQAQE